MAEWIDAQSLVANSAVFVGRRELLPPIREIFRKQLMESIAFDGCILQCIVVPHVRNALYFHGKVHAL